MHDAHTIHNLTISTVLRKWWLSHCRTMWWCFVFSYNKARPL